MTEVMPHLRRVNPIPGMMIDVETWRTAHDYHRDHARLHHRALHGAGIVTGLDVLVGQSVNALLIQPGVAVDPAGNFVIVDREQVYRLGSQARGMVYLVLRYRDAPAEPGAADAATQTRVLESFSIEERTLPPADDDLELARIDFDPHKAAIQTAADPHQPGRNELDTRFRMQLGVAGGAPTTTTSESLPATPRPDHAGAPQLDGMHERLEEIARQVALLSKRQQAATLTAADGPDEPVASDGAMDLQLLDLRQRFDDLAKRFDDLGEQVRQTEAAVPELAQLGRRLDQVTPEIERLTASVEPLERQIQQLADRTEATSEGTWQSQAAPVTAARELRLAIGRIGTAGWDQHLEGLRLLARELVATVEPMARVLDEVSLTDVPQVELLYLTGYAALGLDEAEIQGITRVLESGGVVLGEGCAAGPAGEAGAREFAFSFIELAQRLGRRLTRVERNHRLFEARHKFADPPAGARPARVLEADGVIYSDADYGCAWQGGTPAQPLPRAAIRDAVEFGVNMAIYHQARG